MLYRHAVDTSTEFKWDSYEQLPAKREIEIPDVEEVAEKDPPRQTVEREPYLADARLGEVVNLAIALGRPLLLQGDAGCGKTRLAHAVAFALDEGLPLEECYVKSTTRAQDLLYTYDAVNRLYEAQIPPDDPRRSDPHRLDIDRYIRLGPLGRAIARAQYGRRSVVLIDEIDKADLDFPNDLLWELDRLEFRVTEAPQLHYAVGEDPRLRPLVVITHNEEKALPNAFLRRCIFHYVEFPEEESHLQRILSTHRISEGELSRKAIEVLLRLRQLEDLSKKPGLSELIDWAGYLEAVRTPVEDLDKLPYLGALLKDAEDQQGARREWEKT